MLKFIEYLVKKHNISTKSSPKVPFRSLVSSGKTGDLEIESPFLGRLKRRETLRDVVYTKKDNLKSQLSYIP